LGLVWADTEEGRYDDMQRGYRILKSCLLSGCGIKDFQLEMPPTPVDYVARAIVSLGSRHETGHGIFHISSTCQVGGIFERFNTVTQTLRLLSFYEWVQELKRLNSLGTTLPAVPLMEFAFSMDETAFREWHRLNVGRVSFDCSRTQRELDDHGVSLPSIDEDFFRRQIVNMTSTDGDLRYLIVRFRRPEDD
jgi:myxalamid-type nonribosomal peptide synthetase MxaA